ncbi:MAG: hypothetical protein HYR91_04270 [Flavobacteriia bacterium]|nr:hypothetical protein [Flavobacteriia bacterium]
MFTKEPRLTGFCKELEYYSNDNETILATLNEDLFDRDFNCVIFCRDEHWKFRLIDLKINFEKIENARDWIKTEISRHTINKVKTIFQGDLKKGLDLFDLKVSENKIHPFFKRLNEDEHYKPTKKIISEISNFFHDIDGNFIEQFQSLNGFDSRLWELYLFCLFTEMEFQLLRKYERPDFMIRKQYIEIAIEAVIVNRSKDASFDNVERFHNIDISKEINNDMPLRFGSSLTAKLNKKYWNLPHVAGKPIIIAIADFYDDYSMTISFNSISDYLYGVKHEHEKDENGELIVTSKQIGKYIKGNGTEIESGFFNLPSSENISGVLFSATATISKFTRMGIQAGFGVKSNKTIRYGACYDQDQNAIDPKLFKYNVEENGTESWREGMNLFHNPNALIPIDPDLFPEIGHFTLIDNLIHSITPDFHPFFSFNFCVDIIKDSSK